MRLSNKSILLQTVTQILLFLLISPSLFAKSLQVMVVMSYEKDNPWCKDVKEGIVNTLGEKANLIFFYMDTKKNIQGGPQKALKAYEYFKKHQPDGVIAVDDYAQSMFVVKYLKEKVSTPVMFCGVNADPEKYGYPASHISGILERSFIGPSIAMAIQLVPAIEKVGYIARNSSSGRAIKRQVEEEKESYLATSIDFILVSNIDQLLASLEYLNLSTDLLFIDATNGILDGEGKPFSNRQVTEIIAQNYSHPVIGGNRFHVEYGALCAVIKSGVTQGRVAAEMLLAAIQGTPFSQLEIRRNQYGKRVLNVEVLETLGIHPRRRALLGVELLNTQGSL